MIAAMSCYPKLAEHTAPRTPFVHVKPGLKPKSERIKRCTYFFYTIMPGTFAHGFTYTMSGTVQTRHSKFLPSPGERSRWRPRQCLSPRTAMGMVYWGPALPLGTAAGSPAKNLPVCWSMLLLRADVFVELSLVCKIKALFEKYWSSYAAHWET